MTSGCQASRRCWWERSIAIRIGAIFCDTAMGNPEAGWQSFIRAYRPDGLTGIPSQPIEPGVVCLERRPFFHTLSRRNVMFLGSLIMRREVVQELGAFDASLRGAADWDLFMRLAVSRDLMFRGDVQLAQYLKHAAGMSFEWDHMEEDFIKALASVLRKCELDPEDRRHIEHELKRHWFGWAYQAYDRGDHAVARTRFAQAAKDTGITPGLMAYWAATLLPAGLVKKLRASKQSLGAQEARN